jgi:hypothetical protein
MSRFAGTFSFTADMKSHCLSANIREISGKQFFAAKKKTSFFFKNMKH